MCRISTPIIICLTCLGFLLVSCGHRTGVSDKKLPAAPAKIERSLLVEPPEKLSVQLGQDIPLMLEFGDSLAPDSVQIYLGGKYVYTLLSGTGFPPEGPLESRIPTARMSLGQTGLRLKVFFKGGLSESKSRQLLVLADEAPVEYGYRVLKQYPHDRASYTQGLEYVDGFLYEGTGNHGTSYLRKLNLEDGKVLQQRDLEQKLFGEGITLLDRRIYQLTYRSQVGFVYDSESFEQINKVYYQNREGWGLTNNGEELIMSDGTHVLYFLDPELFTVNRQIEVYTDKGPADSLNELEYIRGRIYANRYYTDEIVIIDPESGKVEGRANLKGILKAADRRTDTDVLNGIAWDRDGDRLFVTGKRWPYLYQIELVVRD